MIKPYKDKLNTLQGLIAGRAITFSGVRFRQLQNAPART